jgi:hypothetical protein
MDELEIPRLHQWLSGCRVLMATSPQDGIDQIDMQRGLGAGRLRLGWNQVGANYIFVPPPGSTEPALNTIKEPEPGTSIHEVPPGPSVLHAHFWHTIMASLASEAAAPEAGWPAERIEEAMRGIPEAHLIYGSESMSKASTKLVTRYIGAMIAARDGSAEGEKRLRAYLAPPIDLVRAYMNFELPGGPASAVLALLLSVQTNVWDLGSSARLPLAQAFAAEYLVKVATGLVRQRATMQVTPFSELSYLANLYFMTAYTLTRYSAEVGGLLLDRQRTLESRAFIGEERRAHQVLPSFHTGLWVNPADHLIETAEVSGESLAGVCRRFGAHPALRASLESRGDDTGEGIMDEYRLLAATYEEYDVVGRLADEFSPVAPENREQIQDALESARH